MRNVEEKVALQKEATGMRCDENCVVMDDGSGGDLRPRPAGACPGPPLTSSLVVRGGLHSLCTLALRACNTDVKDINSVFIYKDHQLKHRITTA